MSRLHKACSEAQRTRILLEKRESDEISKPERVWLSRHLLDCSLCHETAVAEDPTILFFPLAASQDPEAESSGLTPASKEQKLLAAATAQAMELEILRRRFRPAHSSSMLRAASILLAATGLVAALSWGSRAFRDEAVRPGNTGTPTTLAAAEKGLMRTLGTSKSVTHSPWIDGVENPGAKVYQFSPTSQKEPMVVFVVDRNVEF